MEVKKRRSSVAVQSASIWCSVDFKLSVRDYAVGHAQFVSVNKKVSKRYFRYSGPATFANTRKPQQYRS